jgi:Cdc6-like AAA superfamily ATPase
VITDKETIIDKYFKYYEAYEKVRIAKALHQWEEAARHLDVAIDNCLVIEALPALDEERESARKKVFDKLPFMEKLKLRRTSNTKTKEQTLKQTLADVLFPNKERL